MGFADACAGVQDLTAVLNHPVQDAARNMTTTLNMSGTGAAAIRQPSANRQVKHVQLLKSQQAPHETACFPEQASPSHSCTFANL